MLHITKREFQDNLETLREFRDTALPILDTLNRYRWDLQQQQDENTEIIGILDFSDLFRYLHPLLDLTAYRSPERFYAEQVALHYLFTEDSIKLILLSEYIEEYRLSLRSTQVQLSEFAILPEDAVKRRVVRMDKKLQAMLENLESTDSVDPLLRMGRVHQSGQDLLDILFDNARTKVLRRGSVMYERLVSEGKIQHAGSVDGLSDKDLTFQATSEFEALRSRLDLIRPGRRRANDTDARAYHTALCLNRKYFHVKEGRKIFLFITSSPRVVQAFDSDIATDLHGDRGLFDSMGITSIIRTPEYLIVRFLFSRFATLPGGVDSESFHDLLSRYLNVANKLDSYFGRVLSESDIDAQVFHEDYSEAVKLKELLLPCVKIITKFGNSPYFESSMHSSIMSRLGLKALLQDTSLSEEVMREKIAQAVSDPNILVDHFQQNARRLNDSIVELEQHVLSLFYTVGGPSVVYNVHIAESTDSKVVTIAKEIVAALSEQTEDSFKTAFKLLSELRLTHPNCTDTFVLSAKVYRGMRSYREALEHARRALRLSPGYSEALLEVGFCYRLLAKVEKSHSFYNTAWHYFDQALSSGGDDPRVLRELMFLVWLGVEEGFTAPYLNDIEDPIKFLVDNSEAALNMARAMLSEDSRLVVTLLNDRAYYLSMRGEVCDLEEALGLIKQAMLSETNLSQATIGAYKDTQGHILLKRVGHKDITVEEGRKMLQEAIKLIRSAYDINPDSKATQKHMAQCVDLLLSKGYFPVDEGAAINSRESKNESE